MAEEGLQTFIVDEEYQDLRLDVFLAAVMENESRSYIQKLIKDGCVTIDGDAITKSKRAVRLDQRIGINAPPIPTVIPAGEDIPLDILHEDDAVLIINKPSGLVVHPAPGHSTGTLVNAVLHHCPNMEASGEDPSRPGIVHRLDRDTSGVMVVAKTRLALSHLAQQAAAHTFDRRYLALVRSEFKEEHGRINASIGRSLSDRTRMAVTGIRAKDAVTNFEVLDRFGCASLVALQLETGRTHQIRVHMRFAGRPVLGDPVYGETTFKNWVLSEEARAALLALEGQALHAERLGITHPETGERLTFTTPPPADFQRALDALRAMSNNTEKAD